VALVGKAEVQETLLVGREDGAIGGLVVLLGVGGGRGKRRKDRLVASREELGVSEALVVAAVAEELGSVLQESREALFVDAGLVRKGFPVPASGFVQGKNEVIDVLGLGRDLTENNAVAGKRGPA
jgi:hypothetical protein